SATAAAAACCAAPGIENEARTSSVPSAAPTIVRTLNSRMAAAPFNVKSKSASPRRLLCAALSKREMPDLLDRVRVCAEQVGIRLPGDGAVWMGFFRNEPSCG